MFKIFLMITAIISTSYADKHDITVIDDNGNKKYFPTRKAFGKWKKQETERKNQEWKNYIGSLIVENNKESEEETSKIELDGFYGADEEKPTTPISKKPDEVLKPSEMKTSPWGLTIKWGNKK